MRYLLDTNIVSKLFDKSVNGHLRVREKIASLKDEDEVAVSVLTLYELEYGLANAPDELREMVREKIDKVKSRFHIVPILIDGAARFGRLKKNLKDRRSLDSARIHLHNVDLILAATSLSGDWTLVSTDTIYSDITAIEPDLRVEDWLTPPQDSGHEPP